MLSLWRRDGRGWAKKTRATCGGAGGLGRCRGDGGATCLGIGVGGRQGRGNPGWIGIRPKRVSEK